MKRPADLRQARHGYPCIAAEAPPRDASTAPATELMWLRIRVTRRVNLFYRRYPLQMSLRSRTLRSSGLDLMVRLRRISPVAECLDQSPLTEPAAAAHSLRPGLLFMPEGV